MGNMIDDLFYGNLDPTLIEIKRGSDYYKKRAAISTLLESLEGSGYVQESTQLGGLINDLDCLVSRAYFTIGFRWGARMALSIMDDTGDVFDMPD